VKGFEKRDSLLKENPPQRGYKPGTEEEGQPAVREKKAVILGGRAFEMSKASDLPEEEQTTAAENGSREFCSWNVSSDRGGNLIQWYQRKRVTLSRYLSSPRMEDNFKM